MEITDIDVIFAIFTNGEYVQKKKLEELTMLPDIEYYVIRRSTRLGYVVNQYFVINNLGEIQNIKSQHFEVIYIDQDNFEEGKYRSMASFTSRDIYIRNIATGKRYRYISKTEDITFIKKDIIPLLEKLEEFGSWEAYQTSLENETLKKKIKELEQKYRDLNAEYYQLKKQTETNQN